MKQYRKELWSILKRECRNDTIECFGIFIYEMEQFFLKCHTLFSPYSKLFPTMIPAWLVA